MQCIVILQMHTGTNVRSRLSINIEIDGGAALGYGLHSATIPIICAGTLRRYLPDTSIGGPRAAARRNPDGTDVDLYVTSGIHTAGGVYVAVHLKRLAGTRRPDANVR